MGVPPMKHGQGACATLASERVCKRLLQQAATRPARPELRLRRERTQAPNLGLGRRAQAPGSELELELTLGELGRESSAPRAAWP